MGTRTDLKVLVSPVGIRTDHNVLVNPITTLLQANSRADVLHTKMVFLEAKDLPMLIEDQDFRIMIQDNMCLGLIKIPINVLSLAIVLDQIIPEDGSLLDLVLDLAMVLTDRPMIPLDLISLLDLVLRVPTSHSLSRH